MSRINIDGFWTTAEKMEEKFGSVKFKGKKYILVEQAELTNCVDYAHNYNECETGETYWEEWMAKGIDSEGNIVEVIWDFKIVKGEEIEPENYDWSDNNIDRIKER
jgi:hypothetical protein